MRYPFLLLSMLLLVVGCTKSDADLFADRCQELGMFQTDDVAETCSCFGKEIRRRTNNPEFREFMKSLEKTEHNNNPTSFFTLVSQKPYSDYFLASAYQCDPSRIDQ